MPVFDVEADGLLDTITKIHCLSYTNDGETYHSLTDPKEIKEWVEDQKILIGHNIIRYDLRALEKVLGANIKAKIYDTLPLAWYLDHKQSKHGLEYYGDKFRIPKPLIADWENLDIGEYVHRCETDVKINWLLWTNLTKRLKLLYKDKEKADRFLQYLTFKMRCAAHQEEVGVKLDVELTTKCVEELTRQQEEKTNELSKAMPPRQLFKKAVPPKQMLKKDGTPTAHAERWFHNCDLLGVDRDFTGELKIPNGEEVANPNSSDQVKDWLYSLGWEPCTFKYEKEDDGSEREIPQVRKDGELTESVKLLIDKNPAVGILDGLTVIQHRLSIFKGFLETQVNGRVRAEIGGLTNTLRFKHSKPLVNLPGVDKPWGKEIRGCLIADEGMILCGADMVSLESTTKRHYMFPYDPDYVAEMSQPGYDEHLDLAKFAGAVSKEDVDLYTKHKEDPRFKDLVSIVTKIRKKFKATNYSAVYGVGKLKLSRSTGIPQAECANLLSAYWDRNWSVKKIAEDQTVKTLGGEMWLYNPVSEFWISLRYEKDTFSSLNQSTGVFCFDSWLAQCWVRGLKGVFQSHDENVFPVSIDKKEGAKTIALEAIEAVNNKLKLNVPLGVDPQFGTKYSEIH